jgi:farnesyl diphosphate synthase
MVAPDFETQLTAVALQVEQLLDSLLLDTALEGEIVRPDRLLASMRHAALAGGKRLRPFLLVSAHKACGGPVADGALIAAAALECVHCYSLVHDDLPMMDDDDLRRGQPTVHKAFDEATAILAGDGLLTLAFDVIASPQVHPDPRVGLQLVRGLARASGVGGMVGGQMLDLAAEGRHTHDGQPLKLPPEAIRQLQAMKTGALLLFAVEAGAILAGASLDQREALARYGRSLGIAFQIADDVLDVEADSATLGKAVGKDEAKGKATLVQVLGIEAARREVQMHVEAALAALARFGPEADPLRDAVRFTGARKR